MVTRSTIALGIKVKTLITIKADLTHPDETKA